MALKDVLILISRTYEYVTLYVNKKDFTDMTKVVDLEIDYPELSHETNLIA